MDYESFPFIPSHIVLRRYDEIDMINLATEEDYTIDDEAYNLLKMVNGKLRILEILNKFNDKEREDILGALEYFKDEGILELSESQVTDKSRNNLRHLDVPAKNPFEPPYLRFLMINITEKCNLTCKHCYITEKNQVDMPFDKLRGIIQEFYNLQGEKIILTGGEPFLYENLKELLIFLKDIPLKKVLLTNGVLIENKNDILDLIKENNFEVFVSIDGLEDSHNDFRNANCFKDSIRGIELLLEKRITVSINTMIHKKNLEEFDEIAEYLRSLGPIKTWTVEVPTLDDSAPEEIVEQYEVSPEEGGLIMRDYWWGESYEGSSSEKQIQEEQLVDDDEEDMVQYACGPFLMAIDVFGEVSKCGFFTEKGPGNVFDLGLNESWKGIQKTCIWDIRDLKCTSLNCDAIDECRGGCRYRALKHTNDLYGFDPYKCIAYNKIHKEIKS